MLVDFSKQVRELVEEFTTQNLGFEEFRARLDGLSAREGDIENLVVKDERDEALVAAIVERWCDVTIEGDVDGTGQFMSVEEFRSWLNIQLAETYSTNAEFMS